MNLDLLLQAAAVPYQQSGQPDRSERMVAESLANKLTRQRDDRKRTRTDVPVSSGGENTSSSEEEAAPGLSLLSRSAPTTTSPFARRQSPPPSKRRYSMDFTPPLEEEDDENEQNLKNLIQATTASTDELRLHNDDEDFFDMDGPPTKPSYKAKKFFPSDASENYSMKEQRQEVDVNMMNHNRLMDNKSNTHHHHHHHEGDSLKKVQQRSPSPLLPNTNNGNTQPRRSNLVDGVPQPMSLEAPSRPLLYEDLINFPRSRGKAHARRCVMCGHLATGDQATCSIPLQNKDVCKRCDTGIWRHQATLEYFKWCKGCKKFLHVCAFSEKLAKCTTKYSKQPSKCDKCRERGRQSYMSKRLEADNGLVSNHLTRFESLVLNGGSSNSQQQQQQQDKGRERAPSTATTDNNAPEQVNVVSSSSSPVNNNH